MEIDCNGHLWLVDSVTQTIYEAETEETDVCAFDDIPWLSERSDRGHGPAGHERFRSSARSTRRACLRGCGRGSS